MSKVNVFIEAKRKCPGTFDLGYDTSAIEPHDSAMIVPYNGILSFENGQVKVCVEFTKDQWFVFLEQMQVVSWEPKEHHGMC